MRSRLGTMCSTACVTHLQLWHEWHLAGASLPEIGAGADSFIRGRLRYLLGLSYRMLLSYEACSMRGFSANPRRNHVVTVFAGHASG